ncbi:MAG: hypothetical protein IJX28_05280 [Clostridia bacterium]|nr:hypothetical protein [Clostridia bacterium]
MLAVFDCRMPLEAEKMLQREGHATLRLPPHPNLPAPVASHTDMLLFFSGDSVICTREYYRTAESQIHAILRHCKKTLCLSDMEIAPVYPADILLNAATVGEELFCSPTHTASEILREYPPQKLHAVRQGYAKCSVLPVGKRALITQDPSIASAAKAAGIDTLQISANGISLPGYSNGFWGGIASFSPYEEIDRIYFCGNLEQHPEGQAIRSFCLSHGKRPISLGGFPLLDVGTIFMI